jgi:hypothetical protein
MRPGTFFLAHLIAVESADGNKILWSFGAWAQLVALVAVISNGAGLSIRGGS